MIPWSKHFFSFARSFNILPIHHSKANIFASYHCQKNFFSASSDRAVLRRLPLFYGEKTWNNLVSNDLHSKLNFNHHKGDHKRRRETHENRWTRTGVLLSFLAGVTLGATTKLAYNFWMSQKDSSVQLTEKKLFLLPRVLAAKGFNQASDLDESSSKTGEENEDQKASSSNSTISSYDGRGANKGPPKHRHRFNFIADVVERLSPSVAFIEVIDLRRLDANGNPLAVNNGSGVVVDSSGLIITNAHVVTGSSKPRSSKIVVRLVDGRKLDCVLEDIDLNCDLALLRVNATDLTPAPLGSSSELRPGEFVVAVGAPLALSNTITAGVVSSTARCAKDLGISANDINYIQTDAAITFGNSGGPLVNLDGDVIGINSMKAAAGISFAIPVDVAKDFLARSREKMKLKRSTSSESVSKRRRFLGITMLSLTPDIITELQARVAAPLPHSLAHGVLVWRVVIGSPAYHSGLQPGDVITQINGHDITSARDVYALLERPTDLTMIVHRGNQRYTVTVQPEE